MATVDKEIALMQQRMDQMDKKTRQDGREVRYAY